MRCKEVIRQIDSDPEKISSAAQEHIKTCSSCAQKLHAARLMTLALNSARKESDMPTTPFSEVRTMAAISSAAKPPRKENFMSKFITQYKTRPILMSGIGAAIIAFLFVTLVPFSYTQTVGYNLRFSGITENAGVSSDRLNKIFSTLGYDDLDIRFDSDGCSIKEAPSQMAVREITAAIAAVTGSTIQAQIESVIEKKTGSLYAQALQKFKIEVETKGKTDQEIAEEIRQKLIAEGYLDAEVIYATSGDEKHIRVNLTRDNGDEQSEEKLEFHLKDTDTLILETPGALPRIDIETEGKTDAEIKAEMEQRLAEAGIYGAEVEIITNAEGEREIKVTLEKEDKN